MRDLPMTISPIDREGPARSEPGMVERLLADPATRVLEVRGERSPLRADGSLALRPPLGEDADALLIHLGSLDGVAHLAACHPGPPREPVAREERLDAAPFASLREVAIDLPSDQVALFATALGVANWHHRHPRCPRCGEPTEIVQAGWVRRCPHDGSEHYPRTDPAVIVLSAVDPANPYGNVLPWPEHPTARPSRAAGALVVLADGVCLAHISRGGRRLTLYPPSWPQAASRQEVAALVTAAIHRAAVNGRLARVKIEEVDGERVGATDLMDTMRAAGARVSPQGVVIEGSNARG